MRVVVWNIANNERAFEALAALELFDPVPPGLVERVAGPRIGSWLMVIFGFAWSATASLHRLPKIAAALDGDRRKQTPRGG